MNRSNLFLIAIIQIICYIALWLIDEYLASLLSIILAVISLAILLVSLISELIERSKVPRFYFALMLISFIIPVVIGLTFYMLYDGNFDWY